MVVQRFNALYWVLGMFERVSRGDDAVLMEEHSGSADSTKAKVSAKSDPDFRINPDSDVLPNCCANVVGSLRCLSLR